VRQVTNELGGSSDDGGPGTIVDGTGALIPAVEVRAEQHYFLRPLTAAHFRNHILRVRVGDIGRSREQPHPHRLSERSDALDLIRIGRREGESRHRYPPVHVARRAGVGEPMTVGTDRAQQECHRPALRGLLRPIGPRRHRSAVACTILGTHHALRDERDFAAQ